MLCELGEWHIVTLVRLFASALFQGVHGKMSDIILMTGHDIANFLSHQDDRQTHTAAALTTRSAMSKPSASLS